ncbi:hypothetical protein C0992_012322, partial [Termitomyces sp. T32_za158]
MFYGKDERPVFQKGFIRFLYDIRGPTRYFQAALLYIQNFSGRVNPQSWALGAVVQREAIRAGLEKPDQSWGDIFDELTKLTSGTNYLLKDIHKLREDPQLLQRLFALNLLGESVSLKETFTILDKKEPLSTLFDYGWATIVDATEMDRCTIFLPFLTIYRAKSHDPYNKYHPGLTPLCMAMDWKIIEKEDAR